MEVIRGTGERVAYDDGKLKREKRVDGKMGGKKEDNIKQEPKRGKQVEIKERK